MKIPFVLIYWIPPSFLLSLFYAKLFLIQLYFIFIQKETKQPINFWYNKLNYVCVRFILCLLCDVSSTFYSPCPLSLPPQFPILFYYTTNFELFVVLQMENSLLLFLCWYIFLSDLNTPPLTINLILCELCAFPFHDTL